MPAKEESIEALAAELHGEVIVPGATGFDDARSIWNGMIDRRPAIIARCSDESDVAAAVGFASHNDLPLAVRGGGHGVAGQAIADGGVVVDLSQLRAVAVDPVGRTATAQGGCTLADLDAATQEHGLATPLGVVTKTGIAGLTLSGGIGWLRRKHGLSCDNLISARVVTAEGEVVIASEEENADLLWGLRGGGGNFGVVTSLAYRLHPIGPQVHFCFVLFPAEEAAEVLRGVQAHLDTTGDPIAPLGVLGHVPEADEIPAEAHGRPYVAVVAMHTGPAEEGAEATAHLRSLAEPLADLSGTMPYTEAQGALDEDYPDGWRYYWKSINVGGLSDEVIAGLTECNAAAPSHHSTIDVWFQEGAMAEVGETDTAFANRRAPYLLGIEGNWEPDGEDAENVAWVRATYDLMRPHSDGGVYLNFPGFLEEGEDLMRSGYGDNYERLGALKAKYDPGNLFRLNPNVPPAPRTGGARRGRRGRA